jgi:hypothetical protein
LNLRFKTSIRNDRQFKGSMHTNLTEVMGYAAAALVLATFSVQHIAALRCLAIASNLMFIAYAASATLPPVLILHSILLPLNALRLWQALQRSEHTGQQDGSLPVPRCAALARTSRAYARVERDAVVRAMGRRFEHVSPAHRRRTTLQHKTGSMERGSRW